MYISNSDRELQYFDVSSGSVQTRIAAFILGECVGYAIERQMRLRYVRLLQRRRSSDASNPAAVVPAAIPPPLPWSTQMHPLTLDFYDPILEAEYGARAFSGGKYPLYFFLSAVLLSQIVMGVAYTSMSRESILSVFAIAFVIAHRVRADLAPDQQAARWRWGRDVSIAIAAHTMATLWVKHDAGAQVEVRPNNMMVSVIGWTWLLVPIFWHYTAMPAVHRYLYIASSMVLVFMMPQLSMGIERSVQQVWFGGALLFGETIGYSCETNWRVAFIELRNLGLQQQEAKVEVETYRKNNKELVRNAAAKDHFVASLSHEMRTPLNGVLGMIQLSLARDDLPSEVREYLTHASAAGKLLTALLDDTLDVTRLEQGRETFEPSPISLPTLADDVLNIIRTAALAKRLDVRLEVEDELRTAGDVLADARRMQQALLNLLNNAVKFTSTGGRITLKMGLAPPDQPVAWPGLVPSDQPTAWPGLVPPSQPTPPPSDAPPRRLPLLISVRDTGVGISKEDRDLIFLKYTKATHGGRAQDVDCNTGAGLGLSITMAIVQQHQGTIEVHSVPGEGSTFVVRLDLPFAPSKQPCSLHGAAPAQTNIEDTSAADERELLRGKRVLVADDMKVNRLVLCSMLAKFGCVSSEVADGAAAAEAVARQRQQGMPFHAVLMDIQMPIMSGIEATTVIRNREEAEAATLRHNVVIIAVTGFAGLDERKRCLAAHMDDVMTKPFLMDDLKARLCAGFRARTSF